jgi:hypothetical protein
LPCGPRCSVQSPANWPRRRSVPMCRARFAPAQEEWPNDVRLVPIEAARWDARRTAAAREAVKMGED